jgi:hypothetical protein
MSKDLVSKLNIVNVHGPELLSSDQTAKIIDTRGFHSAAIELNIGAGGITFSTSNYIDFTLADSPDNVTFSTLSIDNLYGADAPAAAATSVNGDTVIKSLQAAHASKATYVIGLTEFERYLRCDIEFVGTHGTATALSYNVILSDSELLPADALSVTVA